MEEVERVCTFANIDQLGEICEKLSGVKLLNEAMDLMGQVKLCAR